ncbi:MAG: malto-oligosyltrehalose trehalohydrolase [Pirellulales bacterium]
MKRRLPIGAEVLSGDGVDFRVWAPRRRRVTVAFGPTPESLDQSLELKPDDGGYFGGFAAQAAAGTRYGFRLDDDATVYPDPASRFQPEGVHGPSEVIDPSSFAWSDGDWSGKPLHGQVLYELHLGTFTPEGTWSAAARELPRLKELGITLIEIMPVAEFPGRFGWGYDGVDLFAPTRLYGRPDDFRRFVDTAHRQGLGVMLDVVYNHFGPTGNYLGRYSSDYVATHGTDWGDAVNYDGPNCGGVREFVVSNAGYWIDEFHVDGLRLDAVHAIVDDSDDHILAELTRRVRAVAPRRTTLVIAENENQQGFVLRSAQQGGYGLDAGWNDDFHHVTRVAATGHADHYYADFRGTPQELISAVKWGYLNQGQWTERRKEFRGAPALDLEAGQFVTFLQNHDQVANSHQADRLHQLTTPGRHRALTALWLLAPGTPLFFQGQEFSASAPFPFFADHEPSLVTPVREGREAFARSFQRMAGDDTSEQFPDPCDERTFLAAKLDCEQRDRNIAVLALHRDLLRLRRDDPVFAAQRSDRLHGSIVGPEAFVLRYVGEAGDDRILLVNLGRDFDWTPMTEPLAVPPEGTKWQVLWSSEDPKYGGWGTRPFDERHWYLQGHATLVLGSRADEP